MGSPMSETPKEAPERKYLGGSHGGMTHQEIAKELGISWTRVQQIERAALKKLRLRMRDWQ